MENVRSEGTEDQSVTSPSEEYLKKEYLCEAFQTYQKYLQRYEPGLGSAREWNNDAVESMVYMIQDGDFNITVDTDGILLLLDEWYKEYCMDTPLTVQR